MFYGSCRLIYRKMVKYKMPKKITLESLASMVAKGFEGVDKKFETLEAKMDKKFDEVDKRFGQLDQRFERIELRLDNVAHRFELKDLHGRVSILEKRAGIASAN